MDVLIKNSAYLLFGLTAGFVIWIEGYDNLLTAWNLVPLLAAGFITSRFLTKSTEETNEKHLSTPVAGFVFTNVAVIILAHLAWLFDWGGTATSSSTSGLLFVILPVLAFLAGSAILGVLLLICGLFHP